jgi:uncharacterized protein YndB with AHSA1/START domain
MEQHLSMNLSNAQLTRQPSVIHSTFLIERNYPVPPERVFANTTYLDIVPNRRIVLAYTMAMGDQRFSASLATFEFLRSDKGTDLIFTEQAAFFEGADGPKMREDGWRQLLEQLAAEFTR